jgi:hypothetical protein
MLVCLSGRDHGAKRKSASYSKRSSRRFSGRLRFGDMGLCPGATPLTGDPTPLAPHARVNAAKVGSTLSVTVFVETIALGNALWSCPLRMC